MQPLYEEEWNVVVGKETFSLNEKEIAFLKEKTVSGERGIVWFGKIAISIPHIEAIYRVSRRIKNQLTERETIEKPLMEPEKYDKRLKKIKDLLKEKLAYDRNDI